MMRPSLRGILLCAVVLALAAGPLAAGVVFQVETTYHSASGRGPESSEMSVEKPNLKMEVRPGEGAEEGARHDEAIYRGDRREMVVVDHSDRSYVVIDETSAREVAGQVGGQMSQMMQQVEKVLEQIDDPAMRQRMREMLEQQGQGGAAGAPPKRPASEYRNTGERDTRAGYPCVRWDVYRGGEKVQELWVTDWSNVEGGDEVRDTFGHMAEFWSSMMESLEEAMGGAGGLLGGSAGPAEALTEVDGFPVVTRDFEGGELESETTLRSAQRRTIDPEAFEPPAGYKRRSMLGAP